MTIIIIIITSHHITITITVKIIFIHKLMTCIKNYKINNKSHSAFGTIYNVCDSQNIHNKFHSWRLKCSYSTMKYYNQCPVKLLLYKNKICYYFQPKQKCVQSSSSTSIVLFCIPANFCLSVPSESSFEQANMSS